MTNECMTKDYKHTEILTIRITPIQANSLSKLKEYNVNFSQFIRQAIKEKLQRDWKQFKEKKERTKLPF